MVAINPFPATDVDAVVATIFRILEEVGFKDATPHCIEACTAIGAELGDDGRLRMPRAVVEDVLSKARRNLTLYAQDPEYDLDLSGTRVHFSTAGAAGHDRRLGAERISPLHVPGSL